MEESQMVCQATFDKQGNILYRSEALKTILGCTSLENPLDNIFSYIHSADLLPFTSRLQEMMQKKDGNPEQLQYRLKQDKSSDPPLNLAFLLKLDSREKPLFYVYNAFVKGNGTPLGRFAPRKIPSPSSCRKPQPFDTKVLDRAVDTAAIRGESFSAVLLEHRDNESFEKDFLSSCSLSRYIRKDDTVCKLSENQFLFLFRNIETADDMYPIIQKFRTCLKNQSGCNGSSPGHVLSMGICLYPSGGKTSDQILSHCRQALKTARENNSPFEIHSPASQSSSEAPAVSESEIFQALKGAEFIPWYQPKVNREGLVFGYEALIRWPSPEKGNLRPDQFLPLAEQSELIAEMDNIILRQACIQNRLWQDAGLPCVPVSVNISPRGLVYRDLTAEVKAVLEETGLDPEWLELEIVETGFIQSESRCIEDLAQLRETGVSIALDDFGKGFSSLTKIKDYPIDIVKIDKSFINKVLHDRASFVLTETMISLAHKLNFRVVVEGVETREQFNVLSLMGCDIFQGFLFSPAIPPEEVPALHVKDLLMI